MMAITIGTITKMRGMHAPIATSTATDRIWKDSPPLSSDSQFVVPCGLFHGGKRHANDPRRNDLMKSDTQIQHDVLCELDRERTVVNGTIGVEVHHGVVKLAGRVSDNAIKEDAEVAARRVDDVTNVVMDIDVTGKGTIPQSSDGIAREARVV
jgi:hypothetical protein